MLAVFEDKEGTAGAATEDETASSSDAGDEEGVGKKLEKNCSSGDGGSRAGLSMLLLLLELLSSSRLVGDATIAS